MIFKLFFLTVSLLCTVNSFSQNTDIAILENSNSASNIQYKYNSKDKFNSPIWDLFRLNLAPRLGWYYSSLKIPENIFMSSTIWDYNLLDPAIQINFSTPIFSFSRNINYNTFINDDKTNNVQSFRMDALGLTYLGAFFYKRKHGVKPSSIEDIKLFTRLAALIPTYESLVASGVNYTYKSQSYGLFAGFYVRKVIEENHDSYYPNFNNISENYADLRITYFHNEIGVTEHSVNYFIAAYTNASNLGLLSEESKSSGFGNSWVIFPYAQLLFGNVYVDRFDKSDLGLARYKVNYVGWKAGLFFWFQKKLGNNLNLFGMMVSYPFFRLKFSDFLLTDNIPINQDELQGRGGNYFFKLGLSYRVF